MLLIFILSSSLPLVAIGGTFLCEHLERKKGLIFLPRPRLKTQCAMMKHNRKLQECNLNKTSVFLLNRIPPADTAGWPLPQRGSYGLLWLGSIQQKTLVGRNGAQEKNEGNFPVHPSGCLEMSYSGLGRNFMQISHTFTLRGLQPDVPYSTVRISDGRSRSMQHRQQWQRVENLNLFQQI